MGGEVVISAVIMNIGESKRMETKGYKLKHHNLTWFRKDGLTTQSFMFLH
jgi:hypothetical protein